MDRPVVALLAKQCHDPLRLAERIGADDMGPLGKQRDGIEQLADLLAGIGMAEYRQPEGRLGDEDIAGHDLVGQAGRVARALVVSGHDDAGAAGLDGDLSRAEHMAGGGEADRHVADANVFAQRGDLLGPRQNPRRSEPP